MTSVGGHQNRVQEPLTLRRDRSDAQRPARRVQRGHIVHHHQAKTEQAIDRGLVWLPSA